MDKYSETNAIKKRWNKTSTFSLFCGTKTTTSPGNKRCGPAIKDVVYQIYSRGHHKKHIWPFYDGTEGKTGKYSHVKSGMNVTVPSPSYAVGCCV